MRVIVTRPQPEADRWVAGLARQGFDAAALPLIAIAPVRSAEARERLQAAWQQLAGRAALMFVSANAVQHFFAARPATVPWPWASGTLPHCWAPGPGTAQALVDAGVPAQAVVSPPADAAQFDSETLWPLVSPGLRAGQQVLVVRGSGADGQPAGRDWLAGRLAACGVVVDTVAAYARQAPVWSAAEHALAQQARQGAIWLFSSSEAVGHLRGLVPDSWAQARAVATHPRIADAARAAGFGVVCTSRPALDAVVASIESIR